MFRLVGRAGGDRDVRRERGCSALRRRGRSLGSAELRGVTGRLARGHGSFPAADEDVCLGAPLFQASPSLGLKRPACPRALTETLRKAYLRYLINQSGNK